MDKLYPTPDIADSLQHSSTAEVKFISIDLHETTSYTPRYSIDLPLRSPLEQAGNFMLKRTFDIIVSAILIIAVLSWLIPILAIFIKLDSRGPVFFLQKRTGNGGTPFLCIKLRSMIVNDDAHLLAAQENDGRITRIGAFLRRHHLDELPQLFNVFIGDMSMVGPRPHMINENLEHEKLIKEYSSRHIIKPGITGLAQSLGYFGSTNDLLSLQKRISFDLQYIQTWSFGNDIRILFRTLRMMFGLK